MMMMMTDASTTDWMPLDVDTAYALIVGIGQYRNPDIPKLEYTHADAKAFADLLVDPRRAGLPDDHVKVLLDEQATLFNIKDAISRWLYQHAGSDSTVVVFFGGHGGVEPDASEKDGLAKYLLPWDADPNNLFASALSKSDFDRLLQRINARRLAIFLDACHSGGLPAPAGARDLGAPDLSFADLARSGEGRLVIAAAKENQQSWEDERIGHGIFTHHLLEALEGRADTNQDGYVSVLEVFEHLRRQVPATARKLKRATQEPLLSGDISEDIVLSVDSERIRMRGEELRKQRKVLFDLHDRGELPGPVYREALALLEKLPSQRSAKENDIAEYLHALVNGGITAKMYLGYRERVITFSGKTKVPDIPTRSEKKAPPPPPAARPESAPVSGDRFCIHCGARLQPENAFCIGCGRPLGER